MVKDLIIDEEITLTKFYASDKPYFVEYLNEKEIYDNTLLIPFPCLESDADWWIDANEKLNISGKQLSWAIRKNALLIGVIGLKELYGENAHKDEIGYWLAKPFWGKGIMTKVVGAFCTWLKSENSNLVRIEAAVFVHNKASTKLLEKNGFQFEGTLRKFYKKDGKTFDGLMYALTWEQEL